MTERMLAFGDFQFALDTAAYETLNRTTEARWASLPVSGGRDVLQFTGLPAETVELEGRIYPHFRGGLQQLDTLRDMVRAGEPQIIVSLDGTIQGYWVATRVEERQSHIDETGRPWRQDFRVSLLSHSDDGAER